MGKIDPFKTETIVLRVPLVLGERKVLELNFRPPKFRDVLRMDEYGEQTIMGKAALMSALTGEPMSILEEMLPEDVADCMVIVNRSYQRFTGQINLFDQKEENKNPTIADSPSGTSAKTSAELQES